MGVSTRKWKEGILGKKEEKKKETLKPCPLFTRNNVRLSSGVTPGLILQDSLGTKGSGDEFSARQRLLAGREDHKSALKKIKNKTFMMIMSARFNLFFLMK